MRRRGIATWILLMLGVLAVTLSVLLYLNGRQRHAAFGREQATPLATLDCDLSKPDVHEIAVQVSYPYGHGFKIVVEGPTLTSTDHQPESWLSGLAGTATALNVRGAAIDEHQLVVDRSFASGPDSRAIARVFDSSRGQHELRITVTQGAPALASIPHKLVVYNDVCGCELIVVFYANIVAAISAVVGVVMLASGLARTLAPRATLPPAP